MKKRSSKGVKVDFAGVESGGGRKVPDGNYTAEVVKIEEKESEKGSPYLKWQWKITSKECRGASLWDNTSLQPQALWRLRGLLECLGEEIPEGSMDIDLEEYVGKEARLEVTNEKYNGKDQPRVTGFDSMEGGASSSKEKDEPEDDDSDEKDEEKDEDDDQEEPVKKGATKKKTVEKSTGKFKVGAKVKFKDEDDKVVKGVITAIDDETVSIEDASGEEWEVEVSEISAV